MRELCLRSADNSAPHTGGDSAPHDGPFQAPFAQGVLGHNLQMVLGENLQATVGLNHQLTLGSNLQLFYNPLGLMSGIRFPGLALLGSAVGGNTQLTIDTNVQATYGQNIEINCGYDKLELNNKADPFSTILCGVMGSAILVFSLAYHALDSDHNRTKIALVFQVLVEALIITLVAGTKTQKDQEMDDIRKEMFDYDNDLTNFGKWIAKVLRSPEFDGTAMTLLVLAAAHSL